MENKTALSNIWRKTKMVFLVIFVILIGVGLYFFFGSFSEGYRGGTMIKLSKKGVVFKTYEGQLNVGTFLGNGVNSPTSPIWDFSVANDTAVINKINHAVLTGKRVKLFYEEKFITLPWRGETKYVVNEVELLD